MSKEAEIIQVALAEDHALVRESLSKLLNKYSTIKLVISAANGKILLDEMASIKVDVVLMDLDMPVMNGNEALEMIERTHPKVKVIIFSMHDDPWMVYELMQRGARSFIPKNSTTQEMIKAIQMVHRVGRYFSPDVQWRDEVTFEESAQLRFTFKSEDLEILQMICDGKTSEAIAERVHLSKKSIDAKRADLLKKLDARSPIEFLRKCIIHGLYKARTDEEILRSDEEFEKERNLRKKAKYKD
jgi:DNA-binding NarL/FixJ family response regulator